MNGAALRSSSSMRAGSVQSLFSVCPGGMVGAGAARSGRRTPEPHVWPVAPLHFMHGGSWRGAAMGKSNSSDPEWFSELSSVDQTIARQLIKLHGEAAFRRIANAAVKGQGRRGRPAEQWSDKWLSEGYRRWLLSPDASFEKVAAEVIQEDATIDSRAKNGRIRALRDRLNQAVKEFDLTLKEETSDERSDRLKNPDIFTAVENEFFEGRIKILRSGRAQAFQKQTIGYLSNRDQIREMMWPVLKLPSVRLIHKAKKKKDIRENMLQETRQRRLMRERENYFFLAFEDLVGSLPSSVGMRLFQTVSRYLEDEVCLLSKDPKKT
ncbi:MAG: hypothetical protein ABF689_07565 [Gluconobacter cerinus]|uniref:hypothetical protein n=1 Tax=Gluconobacter cerinus TaxID=38307 RepID=UPI0039E808CC